MGRVESNDEIRIREMQEAQRKSEVQKKEVDRARQTEKSFREALTTRNAQAAHVGAEERASKKQHEESAAKRVLDAVRRETPKHPHEIMKRAALASALHGRRALASRAHESQGETRVLVDRADHHDTLRARENEHVEETTRDDDVRDVEVREERLEETRRETENLQIAEDLDRERRRDRRGRDERGRDDRREAKAEGAAPARTAGSAAPRAPLPPEVIKRIVGTITKVVDEGRTRLRVRLQGAGLEGVELEVRSESGEVACAFSGCSDRLRRDLEGAEPVLREALSKRGLRLKSLKAVS